MTGIEKIVARLEADAQADRDAVAEASRKECEAILEEYYQQAQGEYEKRIREGLLTCNQREERLASAAEMETKKDLLAFKQELVSDAFTAAVARIANLPRAEYVAFLSRLAAQASQYRCEELIFNAKDAASVGKDVVKAANAILGEGAHLTVSEETRDIPGGFIAKHGSIETNCALDTMVLLRRGDLAAQVAELLFN